MSQLSQPDLALYRAVDEVLHYLWDPIGVASVPEARDEYHCYLPAIFVAISRTGVPKTNLPSTWVAFATNRMGLSARPDHDRAIARHLLNWKAALSDQQGQ